MNSLFIEAMEIALGRFLGAFSHFSQGDSIYARPNQRFDQATSSCEYVAFLKRDGR